MATKSNNVETLISDFFSQEEVSRLEAGLPRLQEWSDSTLVPFQVQQLKRHSLLWINTRWFLQRGLDITHSTIARKVSSWLHAEFGFLVPREGDPADAFTTRSRTVYADRYGSSEGKSSHGGSGRVATIGCYQAKGIGVTPLVGTGAHREYLDGCASIEEGVREAIFAEIADAEFPHHAVPVVAILDTGLYFSKLTAKTAQGEKIQRAIVVRPAVLRLAHFERAPLFSNSLTGYPNSQLADVQRTKTHVRRWLAEDKTLANKMPSSLNGIVRRIAEQIAFGQVHRLFNGGYFSSNLSAEGALLDFGGMRALPNWTNARNMDHTVGFGDEMKICSKVIQSLVFYFNKYRPNSIPLFHAAELLSLSEHAHAQAFAKECLRIWNVPVSADTTIIAAIMEVIRRYFTQQQRLKVNYKHGLVAAQAWLYDFIVDRTRNETSVGTLEQQAINAIQETLRAYFAQTRKPENSLLQAWSAASRYLRPRDVLDRERLQEHIYRVISAADTRPNSSFNVFRDLIRSTVGLGRRHWPRLPRNLTVEGHVAYEGSSALQCVDGSNDQRVLWLEGIRAQGRYWLFDTAFAAKDAEELGVRCEDTYWTAQISTTRVEMDARLGSAVKLTSRSIQIPAMQVAYAKPSSWLSTGAQS